MMSMDRVPLYRTCWLEYNRNSNSLVSRLYLYVWKKRFNERPFFLVFLMRLAQLLLVSIIRPNLPFLRSRRYEWYTRNAKS